MNQIVIRPHRSYRFYGLPVLRTSVCALAIGFLTACGSSAATVSPPAPTHDVCKGLQIQDGNMCFDMGPQATILQQSANVGKQWGFSSGGLSGQFSIAPLSALAHQAGAPANALQQIRVEDLRTLALTIDGVSTSSTNFHIPESPHFVIVDGQQCVQLGSESTYQGQTGDGVYLNCRYRDELYNLIIGAPAPSIQQLDATTATLVRGWHWK